MTSLIIRTLLPTLLLVLTSSLTVQAGPIAWEYGRLYYDIFDFYHAPGLYQAVRVDNFIFGVEGTTGVQSFEILTPGSIRSSATYDLEGAQTIANGGGYLYVLDDGGLKVFDASEAPHLTLVGNLPGVRGSRSVYAGGYLYASDHLGIRTLDVSDPALPVLESTLALGSIRSMTEFQNSLYVGVDGEGLVRLSLGDPANPQLGSIVFPATNLGAVTNDGTYLFLCDPSSGVRIFKESKLGGLTQVGLAPYPGALSVGWGDDELIIGGNSPGVVAIADISDPQSPVPGGSFARMAMGNGFVEDGFAYIAAGVDGLQVLRLGDRSSPLPLASWTPWQDAMDLIAIGELLHVLFEDRVEILDVSNPLVPTFLGSADFPSLESMAVAGDRLYLAGSNTLYAVDVSDPAVPVTLGSLTGFSSTEQLEVEGDRVYGRSFTRIRVADVSDPTQMSSVRIPTQNLFMEGMAVADDVLFYSNNFEGVGTVYAYDVSDPESPVYVDEAGYLLFMRSIAIRNDRLYIASSQALGVVDLTTQNWFVREVGDYPFSGRIFLGESERVYNANGGVHTFVDDVELQYFSSAVPPEDATVYALAEASDYVFAAGDNALHLFSIDELVAGIETDVVVPESNRLSGFPNPSSNVVSFDLSSLAERFETHRSESRGQNPLEIGLDVFDTTGRRIRSFRRSAARLTEPGNGPIGGRLFEVTWDGRDETGADVPNGVYLVRAVVGSSAATGRVQILR